MFARKDPRKKDREQHWTMDSPEPGQGFNAWKAGELIGVLCHWNYRSIPCWDELTDGALECPHHATSPNLHWVGYLPLYTEENRPTVVIVRAAMQEIVNRIAVHAPVYVSRPKKRGAGVSVRPKSWAKQWQPPKGFGGPADIRPWLLKLWKEDELTKWVRANPKSDSLVSQCAGGSESNGGGGGDQGWSAAVVDECDPDVMALRATMARRSPAPPPDHTPVSLVDAMPSLNGRHRGPGMHGTHRKGEG